MLLVVMHSLVMLVMLGVAFYCYAECRYLDQGILKGVSLYC